MIVSDLARRRAVAGAARLLLWVVGLGATTALRGLRLFPNNDPILAVALPYAERGHAAAAAFPVAAMVLFDLLSGRVGIWTAVTAGTYGLIGLAAAAAFAARRERGRSVGVGAYLVSGVVGVLVFDVITGPILSSLIFRLSFIEACVGQVPFTLKHLASVSAYACLVSPAVDWLMRQIERAEVAVARRLAPRAAG